MDGGAAAQVRPGTGRWSTVDEVIGLPVGALDAERLLAAVPEAVLAVREGTVLYANAQAVVLLGPAAAAGACAETLVRGWTDLPNGGTFEGVLPLEAGSPKLPVEVAVSPLGDEGTRVVVVRDATDRFALRDAEVARMAVEARYKSLIEQIPAVVYADEGGEETTYVSPQIERDPRRVGRGVPGRPRDVDADGAPRRSRPRAGGERGVHRRRRRRPGRLPDGPPRRLDRVDPGPRVRGPRRHRPGAVGARDPVRRHRAEGGRGADRAHGVPRRPHRPREPGALRGVARPRDRTRAARRALGRGAVPRPRQLQAGERHDGAPRRRRAAPPVRRPAAREHPRRRPGGAPGRRRVPDAAGRPGGRRGPRDRRGGGRAGRALDGGAVHGRGTARSTAAGRSGSACTRWTRPTPRG